MIPAKPLEYKSLAESFRAECTSIADWWLSHAFDTRRGGLWGAVSDDNRPDPTAPKCIVLHARTLWFFSEWGRLTGRAEYMRTAARCHEYLVGRFYDDRYDGVVWMLESDGRWANSKKQTYAQAFAIYALAAYFDCSGDDSALDLAWRLFTAIEKHAKDRTNGGYREALSRNWFTLDDARLSEKEDHSPKTMNTHLHMLEAYTQLHETLTAARSPRAERVAPVLADLLDVYCNKIYNPRTGHLKMFMDDQWNDRSRAFSYGHEIESSWLIDKAIKTLHNSHHSRPEYKPTVMQLADTCLREGISRDGSMADEFNLNSQTFVPSAWWVQAEAMVGFTNVWKCGGDGRYLSAALGVWQNVQEQYRDRDHGEWFWFARKDHHNANMGYKTGPWKAPYHNGRAMMQMTEFLV